MSHQNRNKKRRSPSSKRSSSSGPDHPQNPSPREIPSKPKRSLALGHARHKFAWKHALEAPSRSKVHAEVQGLPVALRTQGLGVTVAMLIQRDSTESRWLANTLAVWLLRDCPCRPLTDPEGERSAAARLLDSIVQTQTTVSVAAAQREAITVTSAIKRIVGALEAEAKHGG